ncbi:MAG: ABC transporter substrate-binding protein [Heliobacteriaceae bacterium]|nr:ABC transporter substrate-binding protein [Heliobacteriaceae bacterium]
MPEKTGWSSIRWWRRILAAFTGLTVLMVLISGCGEQQLPVSPGGQGFPLTVTDDLGRTVTLKQPPQRIVSLAPVHTEMLFALGLADRLVGVTEYCDYPAAAKDKPKIGGFATPSAELIVAAQPDLVLATGIHQEFSQQLTAAGLPVVVSEALDLAQVPEKIRFTGQLTGETAAAEKLAGEVRARIDRVAGKVGALSEAEKQLVYFEVWPNPLTTGGAKSFLHSLITTAGARNVAGDVNQDWVTYSPEVLFARDPDVIICVRHGAAAPTVEELKKRPGWDRMKAVRENRVGYIADQNMVLRPGPRVVEGLELMAGIIYPELFAEQTGK